jgi:hypothetical protein
MSLNYTTITATNTVDASGAKLVSGTIAFQGVDGSNRPVPFQVGGSGTVITTPATATITNGAIVGTFQVANPQNTIPSGILYNITVTDTTLKKVVATYSLVPVSGDSFNLDNYAPADSVTTPLGSTINGPLVVNGNLSVTGTLLSGAPGAGAETKLGTFSIAATTWTLVHSFGTQAVQAQCYDNSFNVIFPDTLQNTDVNTTVATFLQAQIGYMVVVNVGNWTPSVQNPNYIIGNPTSSQSVTGDYPFTFGGSLATKRFANLRFADQFGSLAAAYADLPSTGGTVVVPDGYNETLTASITLSKSNSGFWFLGSANITMGAFQIIVPANTFGIFFRGTIPFGDAFVSPHGALFSYSGNSNAFQLGTGVGTTSRWVDIENIGINLTGTTGIGIYMTNVVYFSMNRVYVAGTNLIGQTGIVLDGTGNFCGTGTIINPNISFLGTCILGKSALGGADAMNAVTIIGGTLSTNVVGGIGLNIDSGFQNQVYGTDFESNTIAVKFGADAVDNYIDMRSEVNTTDFSALGGSQRNIGRARGNASIVVSDSGTDNHFMLGKDSDFNAGRFVLLTSKTANPANGSNSLNLAVTDIIAWRNAANNANHRLRKTGAASGNIPADVMFFDDGAGNPVIGFWQTPVIASSGTTPAVSGQVRLGSADSIAWRNNGNSGDVVLGKNASDSLTVTGTTIATSATAGANGAVPAQVAQYLTVSINGTIYKIPLFNT